MSEVFMIMYIIMIRIFGNIVIDIVGFWSCFFFINFNMIYRIYYIYFVSFYNMGDVVFRKYKFIFI